VSVSCTRPEEPARPAPEAELSAALAPAAFARALRAAGGGRFAATTSFRVHPRGATGADAERTAVTTTTELVVDRHGHFRLVETNDRDGGREVVAHGKELSVALRYGKPTKRTAREPEPTRLLEEALGGPWAAWEVASRQAAVTAGAANDGLVSFRVARAQAPAPARGGTPSPPPPPLAAWRASASVTALEGEVKLDASSKLPRAVRLDVRFGYVQGGAPYEGHARVEAKLEDVGRAPEIGPPAGVELAQRRRPVLEERALLGRAVAPSLGRASEPAPPRAATPTAPRNAAPAAGSRP
jgi:hypothetical protein